MLQCRFIAGRDLDCVPDNQLCRSAWCSLRLIRFFSPITDFFQSMSERKDGEVIGGVSLQPLHSGKAPLKWAEILQQLHNALPQSRRLHPGCSVAVNLDDTGYNGSAVAAPLTQISFFTHHLGDTHLMFYFVVLTRVHLPQSQMIFRF